ncbi:hypothetical protein LTR56_013712 [Elasticomyces elasticus]|nr:hypothetical protein LTR56_013712 [Elasticomyces elasticus]KAK3668466.1 hypothetical protein LTR22_000759 [Elasticomyces elasticus]KAK4930845.1 hypothetical protein LTR49_002610 [Elasticomyces elasticus]KAK5753704.1 hypothetical protein LTS12_016229 [Elasticomyces elasticus]
MDGAPPDLQAILATLSQFTNATPDCLPTSQHDALSAYQYEHSTAAPIPAVLPTVRAHDPRLRPQSRSATASPKPIVDPATIITWQEGLRCVTKIAAQNAQFAVSIRRMIEDQKKNEMRWYAERQALKQSQATRSTASAHAQSILQSLGSTASSTPATQQTQSEKDAELAEFDRKIYSAQVSMEVAMTSELKGLGVPFFGTRAEKILAENQAPEERSILSSTITEAALIELRKKMVGHLEDLYRD